MRAHFSQCNRIGRFSFVPDVESSHLIWFILGIWRLPIIFVALFTAAKFCDAKRREMITYRDLACAQMVERHPQEFRDILERKKTYDRHFTGYSRVGFL